MEITQIPTEQTTAVTDVLLAVVALFSAIYLIRYRRFDHWKVILWSILMLTISIAAALSAIMHCLILDEAVKKFLWIIIGFFLNNNAALVVVVLVYDWKNRSAAKQALPIFLCIVIIFFVITQFYIDWL